MLDQELMKLLFDLYFRLHHHQGDGAYRDSLLEKYNYFINNSSLGSNCTYAEKSKYLFEKYDWEQVRGLVLTIADRINRVK